ncbi:protein HtrL [Aplysia californica]|uniref:Protein HtrL n=1 Tax=Aplysia californica TaxID=6500 RepID=A0ABM0JMM2_APLCA|nr:protein HtrL [Aplysia californica]
MDIMDLEYFPLLKDITNIMQSQQFQAGNENYRQGKVEGTNPLYNMVTNSKVSLVHQAIRTNPFGSDYFVWLDGGYGHGDATLYPPDGVWNPEQLWMYPNKVSFVALYPLTPNNSELDNLHKVDTALIAGGLFAGGTAAMERYYNLHREVMQMYMQRGSIDDDQTTFSDCYYKQPDNFRPVLGDWYDLLKPFRPTEKTKAGTAKG